MASKNKKKHKKDIKSEPPSNNKYLYGLIAVIILTLITYSRTLQFDIINFDDQAYVSENPLIQNPDDIQWGKIFSEPYYGGYYPLTLASFAIDLKLAGENPVKMLHFTNLLLHLLNVILLWLFVLRLFKNPMLALIVSALFALHPLHIESFAWISERKDVLYTAFYLLSLLAYLKYQIQQKKGFYILTFLFFVASGLSKTMAVSLVPVLFLIDYFLHKKVFSAKLLIEKIPFVVLAIILGIVSIKAQTDAGIINQEQSLSFIEKISYACFAFFIYIFKLLIPINLAAFHPYPEHYSYIFIVFILLFAALIYILIRQLKHKNWLTFGSWFFLFNIIPVLQWIQINNFMWAERFSYVSSIGFFMVLGYGFQLLIDKYKLQKQTLWLLLGAYFITLGLISSSSVKTWQNSETVWTNITDKYPDRVPKAYYFRGHFYAEQGLYKQALVDFNKVITLAPPSYLAKAYHSRSTTFANMGQFDKAMNDVDLAIQTQADDPSYYYLKAVLYKDQGMQSKTAKVIETMLNNCNYSATAYYFAGLFSAQSNDFEKAIGYANQMIKIEAENAQAYYLRGMAYFQSGDPDSGCSDFKKASELGLKEANEMIKNYCH